MSDLINRADAIEAVQTYLDILINGRRHGDDFTFINVLTDIRNKISALPSAEAVPQSEQYKKGFEDCKRAYEIELARSAEAVQGEWTHDGQNFKGGLDWCHCSVCGYKTSTNGISIYRYCPNCGARMTPYKGGNESRCNTLF